MSNSKNHISAEEQQSLLRATRGLIEEEEQLEDVNLHTQSTVEPTINIDSLLAHTTTNKSSASHNSYSISALSTSSPQTRSFYLASDAKNNTAITPTAQPPNTTPNIQSHTLDERQSLSQASLFSSEQNVKFLSPPVGAFTYYPGGTGSAGGLGIGEGSEEEEEEDILQALHARESSLFLNRVVSYSISFALLCSFIAVIVIYVNFNLKKGGSDDDISPIDTCYAAPSCPAVFVSPSYDVSTGFTNFTGWQNSLTSNQCCNICPPAQTQSYSLKSRENSRAREGEVNFDYLVLDQMWLPQFCHALSMGHDPTLSHLSSDRCKQYVYSLAPQLVIHGLWPNRIADSLLCCGVGTTGVPTLDLGAVQSWSFYEDLMKQWFDPTVNGTYFNATLQQEIQCSYCYLLNHEWQKHGSCFGFSLDDVNQKQYFESGLVLAQVNLDKTNQINAMYGSIVTKTALEQLYAPYKVNVMCDPQDSYTPPVEGATAIAVLLEIQTCWDVVLPASSASRRVGSDPIRSSNFTMIDCPSARNSSYSAECSQQIYIRDFSSSSLSLVV